MNWTRCLDFMERGLIFLFVLFFSSTCTYHFKAPTEFSLSSNKAKIIPLRAALHIKTEYRDLMVAHNINPVQKPGFYPISYALGDSFLIGSKKIAENLFRDVVVYETLKAETEIRDIDVIVTPDIMVAKFYAFGRRSLAARIEVKWTILDRGRKEIYVNTFVGESTGKMKPFVNQNKELGRLMDAAVLEVYRKAGEGLSAIEWWKAITK